MIKLDIVLQGLCGSNTKEIIETYLSLEFVDKIILSSYASSLNFNLPDRVVWVDNKMIDPVGCGNRNLQINTSKNGLAKVTSKYCVKMRSDQLIRSDSMRLMYNFWITNDDPENRKPLPNNPLGRIYVCGLYRNYPYHPRDHVFWGFSEDVKNLCDVPFDLNPDQSADYNTKTRAETYLAQYYYTKYDSSIQEHVNNAQQFLTDAAPYKSLAMAKDWENRDRLFKVFPKISLSWPKHGLDEYHYDVGAMHSEYWAD